MLYVITSNLQDLSKKSKKKEVKNVSFKNFVN